MATSTVLTLTNTLIAGNTNDNVQPSNYAGTMTLQGYNLVQITTIFASGRASARPPESRRDTLLPIRIPS